MVSPTEKQIKDEKNRVRTLKGKIDKLAQRKELFEKLSKTQLDPTQSSLLRKTSTIGKKESARDLLHRAFSHQKAGIATEETLAKLPHKARIDTEVKLSAKISEDAQMELNKLIETKEKKKKKRKKNKKKHALDTSNPNQKGVSKSNFFTSKDIDSDDEREVKRQKRAAESKDESESESESGSEEEDVTELNMPNTIKQTLPQKEAPATTANLQPKDKNNNQKTTSQNQDKTTEVTKPPPAPISGSWITGIKFDRVIPKRVVEEEEDEDDEDGDQSDADEYEEEDEREEEVDETPMESASGDDWDLQGFEEPDTPGKYVLLKPSNVLREEAGDNEEDQDSEGEEDEDSEGEEDESEEEQGDEGEDEDEEEANGEEAEKEEEEIEVRPNPFIGILKEKETFETDRNAKKFHVFVDRKEEIKESRGSLPIIMEEHNIMETITANDVVIICGETGSGKTTQVPQFLYEAGYGNSLSEYPGMIGITQPRRVAAVSMAMRVEKELNVEEKGVVAYQIRYDKTVEKDTQMKFMTDGILMKEVQSDFLLSRYSCIIIDEAHERNVNTDILIGFLSRIVPLRRQLWLEQKQQKDQNGVGDKDKKEKKIKKKVASPLKLIIMSATLRVEDFTSNQTLFKSPPPVVNIPARQYPVSIHFNKKTESDYLGAAFKKVCKIHRQLPTGGILVFVTGQHEVEGLCRKLREKFSAKNMKKKLPDASDKESETEKATKAAEGELSEDENDGKILGITKSEYVGTSDEVEKSENPKSSEDADKNSNNGATSNGKVAKEDEKMKEDSEEDEDKEDDFEQARDDYNPDDPDIVEEENVSPLYVLPLYSALATSQQLRVFKPPPEKSRLVVVATNVAETSLTIPNIKYVVDTGKAKVRHFEKISGISSFLVDWTSKASADQRAGRAGRTGPGHCYRLYSSAVFTDIFKQFSEPEILLLPIDGILLQMKTMNIAKLIGFPFPTPPDTQSVKAAIQTLTYLEALDKQEKITELGRSLSAFPLSPRYGKMLVMARKSDCMAYVIALVAALSVHDPLLRHKFSHEEDEKEEKEKSTGNVGDDAFIKKQKEKEKRNSRRAAAEKAHRRWAHPQSDLLAMLKAVGAYEHEFHIRPTTISKFCEDNYLLEKSMKEIHQLRHQLTAIVNMTYPEDTPLSMRNPIKPPDAKQEIYLRQVLAVGLIDQVARLAPTNTMVVEGKKTPKRPYQIVLTNEHAYIHPSSYLSNVFSEYVVFTEIVVTGQAYMQSVTAINAAWLPAIAQPLLGNYKLAENPPPRYDPISDSMKCFARVSYGPHVWELPAAEVTFPETADKYKWFARALLEGLVCPPLRHFLPHYETHPLVLTRSFGHPRIVTLLQPLADKKIDSKEKLLAEWDKDKKFLFTGVLSWVKERYRQYLVPMWPPLDELKVPAALRETQ